MPCQLPILQHRGYLLICFCLCKYSVLELTKRYNKCSIMFFSTILGECLHTIWITGEESWSSHGSTRENYDLCSVCHRINLNFYCTIRSIILRFTIDTLELQMFQPLCKTRVIPISFTLSIILYRTSILYPTATIDKTYFLYFIYIFPPADFYDPVGTRPP